MNTPRPSMRLLHTHFLPGLPRAAQWTFGLALLLLALGAPHTLYPTPWARTTALYVGASGLILLLLATVRVSRHLRETEALQKRTEVARQRFARVVEQTSEIVFITDARGTIDYVNHACEEATGYRAAELLGHKPSLFKSGLHDADFYLHLWGTLLGGHIFTAVFANRRKNGEIYYEEKSIAPIRDDRGQIAHFVSTGRDITARHLAESALTQNEERLRIATLQTGQCIYDHALGPGVIRWIGATRELLGRTLGELADHDLADWTALIHPDDREDYTRRLHETQQAGGRYAFEYRIIRKDGSILFVADRGAVLCDEQGHPLRRIGAILDISERKRFEAELHQAKDELELRVQERSAEVIASERRFRAIFENSGTAIAYSDRAGIVQFVNQAFCELVGYSHEELAGQHTGKFTHPSDLLAEVPMLQEINTGKRDHYRVEKRFLTKDGITRWIDLSVAVIRDDRNTPLHLVSTALDITARKAIDRREQQLRTSLERLARGSPLTSVLAEIVRAIEEESPGARGAIFLTSPERDCLQIGAAPSLPHAFSRAIEGTPIDTEHGVSASAAASCRRIIAQDLHSFPLPESIRDATDRASLLSAWAEPVLATDGQVIGVFTIFHHTRHAPSPEEIHLVSSTASLVGIAIEHSRNIERLRKLSRAVEFSPASIVVTDLHGKIEYVNPKFTEITGYTQEEALGKNPRILRSPCTPPEVHKELWKTISAGQTWHGEFQNLKKNGEEYWEFASISPITDAQGRPTHYIAVKEDITARKHTERALQQAKLAAENAAQAKSEFLAAMSHEIRTPMNGVVGMTQLLLGTTLSAQQRDFAETIRSSADTLLTIINDILDFSKIEARKMPLSPADTDLLELVEAPLDLLAERAQSKNLDLLSWVAPAVPRYVKVDPVRLRQILTNLIGNAIKFTDHGEIWLRVQVESQDDANALLRFAVTDTGIGISPSDLTRLFEAFSQVDASTVRRAAGTGLGLAISKQLVELMGGHIGVESREGEGSTFWFTLPLPKTTPPAGTSADLDPACLAGLRVLILHPSANVRNSLAQRLQPFGIQVSMAMHTADALALANPSSGNPPHDIALVHFDVHGRLGWDFAEAIWADPSFAKLKIVALVPLRHLTEIRWLEQNGIHGVLGQPVRQIPLLQTLGTLSGRFDPPKPAPAQPAPPPIDSHPLHHKPEEFRLLLVDDNTVNQKVAKQQLARLGYHAEVAGDGLAALRAVENRPFDLILMDCQMPDMDGYETSRRIRQWERQHKLRPTHILAMTANALQGDREKCLSAGMNDYLSKPVRLEDLKAALARGLGLPAPQQ